ncbi:MAG TPA: hypothetical protein VLI46_06445 [Ramlibacter sp.]|nr:hypothetical protein [Ramlibacter sp.]
METDEDGPRVRADGPPRAPYGPMWAGKLQRPSTWVPALAVGVVALVALGTAVMSERAEPPGLGAPRAPALASSSSDGKSVVTAPPLKTSSLAPASAMGAPPDCGNCGVVQMVVAMHGYAQARASGYQMHIRMDDGTMRTVEQRGALAPGSRVRVERGAVRLLPERAGQG